MARFHIAWALPVLLLVSAPEFAAADGGKSGKFAVPVVGVPNKVEKGLAGAEAPPKKPVVVEKPAAPANPVPPVVVAPAKVDEVPPPAAITPIAPEAPPVTPASVDTEKGSLWSSPWPWAAIALALLGGAGYVATRRKDDERA